MSEAHPTPDHSGAHTSHGSGEGAVENAMDKFLDWGEVIAWDSGLGAFNESTQTLQDLMEPGQPSHKKAASGGGHAH